MRKHVFTICKVQKSRSYYHTVKFLNFQTPENFAVIYLKFKQRGQTLGYFIKKMQMELQTVKTLIRLLLELIWVCTVCPDLSF